MGNLLAQKRSGALAKPVNSQLKTLRHQLDLIIFITEDQPPSGSPIPFLASPVYDPPFASTPKPGASHPQHYAKPYPSDSSLTQNRSIPRLADRG